MIRILWPHRFLGLLSLLTAVSSVAFAGDWPQWGGQDGRNMVSDETNLPSSFEPGRRKPGSIKIDPATTKNILWTAKLGSQTYGNPTVAGGRVYVGTNDSSRRDPKHRGDGGGAVLCLDEKTGEMLWQLVVPRKRGIPLFDNLSLGVCSSPTVEGDRVYVVTNRAEILCLDVKGLADGNDGPFVGEAEYMTVPDSPTIELGATDADIVWRFDIYEAIKTQQHDATDCSILVHGDYLYVGTHNSVDQSHSKVPYPEAPTLLALDKTTGKMVGADDALIGTRLFHGQWSSPSLAKVGDRAMVLYGAGDGFCYAFDPRPTDGVLKTVWRCDANPPEHKMRDGEALDYHKSDGPSEIIGTPIFHDNRVYVTVGQDPRHGDGVGALTCIDATKTGDVSASGVAWRYTDIGRSLSTVSVADGLVYVGEFNGKVHCLDAETGKPYWVYDTKGRTWGSTLVADGKVYIGNERFWLTILATGKEQKVLARIRLDSPIYCTPVAANGVLYVATQRQLYAIKEGQ